MFGNFISWTQKVKIIPSFTLQFSHITQYHFNMDCNIILHYHSLHSLIFSCSDHPVASLLLDWFLLNLIGSLLWIQARCLGSFQKQFHQFALTQSSLCVVSVFIQKFMEHISLCGKCPLTLLQIVLCHHSKSYFKQSSTQIIYQSSMLQDLSLQDFSHCPDPEYCYTQFIKLEVFTHLSTNPHYNHTR